MRPRNLSVAALNDCAPKLIRFTPAARIPVSFARSTVPGFASSVISASCSMPQTRLAASMISPMDFGSNSEGVPPPKKIVLIRSPEYDGVFDLCSSSEINARVYCASGHDDAVCELKSQYGHFDWHHGMWT